MREIKFKAKRLDNKEWIYGYYFIKYEENPEMIVRNDFITLPKEYHFIKAPSIFIGLDSTIDYEIDPETLCQFTGLKDKNGKEIYDGHIVEVEFGSHGSNSKFVAHIKWCEINKGFRYVFTDSDEKIYIDNNEYNILKIKIIGNIHEQ